LGYEKTLEMFLNKDVLTNILEIIKSSTKDTNASFATAFCDASIVVRQVFLDIRLRIPFFLNF
jgi:hypothetical protein